MLAQGVMVAPDELTPVQIWRSPKQMAVLCWKPGGKIHAGWIGDAATLCGHPMWNPESHRVLVGELGESPDFCTKCGIREES